MNKIEEIQRNLQIIELLIMRKIPVYKNDYIFPVFTDETTSSLKIYQDTDTFKAYSTGEKGDIIDLVRGSW